VKENRPSIYLCIAVTLILCWALEYLLLFQETPMMIRIAGVYIFPLMLAPAVVAIVFMVLRKEKIGDSGWGISGVRNWLIALLYPVFLVAVVVGIGQIGKILTLTKPANYETIALATALDFPLIFLWTILMTLGTELGWRGYVLRILAEKNTLMAALVSSGAWALSQTVTIYYLAIHSAQGVLLGAILFLDLFLIGLIFAWLYLRSHSLWTVALMSYGTITWNVLLFGSPFFMINEIILGSNYAEYRGMCEINLGGVEHGEWRLVGMVNFVVTIFVIQWLIRKDTMRGDRLLNKRDK
jgi:membrane protease YdiL (CAAX protease family)